MFFPAYRRALQAGRRTTLGLVEAPAVQRRPLLVESAASSAHAQSPASTASLLLGQGPRSSPSLTRVVQQSNSVFAKVRSGQSSNADIVSALQQLAGISRDLSAQDVLEGITGRDPFRRLLDDLVRQLPRDSSEEVPWESSWTSQVTSSLQALQVSDVDPQLGIRLGNTLVQAASHMELDILVHAMHDICAIDSSGLAPDDYALWVLGIRLEELCQSKEPGQLRTEQLVSVLHLFAHPSTRGRVPARGSVTVMKHVRHCLPSCTVGQVAKLLQAYSDVPDIKSDVLTTLTSIALNLSLASLPELAAVGEALLSHDKNMDAIAVELLNRLLTLASKDVAADFDAELALICLTGAAQCLSKNDPPGQELLVEAVQAIGERLFGGGQNPTVLPAAALGQFLSLALVSKSGPSTVPATTPTPEWLRHAAIFIVRQMGELSPTRLAELAAALSATAVELDPSVIEALQTAATARADTLSPSEFSTIAFSLALTGTLEDTFLEAFDIEALLVRLLEPAVAARSAWVVAFSEARSPVAAALAVAQLERQPDVWLKAPQAERALLYEALAALGQDASAGHGAWEATGSVTSILMDDAWRDCWHQRRATVSPPSAYNEEVAQLLAELNVGYERGSVGDDGLYIMPFLLPGDGVILDMLAARPRHPVSGQPRGELALRHRAWQAAGRSVLAIPDATWAQLGDEQRQKWLSQRISGIAREDLIKESGLQPETIEALSSVPFGDGGLALDGLQRLAQQPAPVRSSAVKNFIATWQNGNVRNFTGWLIGIINAEKAAYDERQQASKRKWSHPNGKPLEEAREMIGKTVRGKVTSVLHTRCWADTGFVFDVAFSAPFGTYSVGESVSVVLVQPDEEQIKKDIIPAKVESADTRSLKGAAPSKSRRGQTQVRDEKQKGERDQQGRRSSSPGKGLARQTTTTSRRAKAPQQDSEITAPGEQEATDRTHRLLSWKDAASPRPTEGWDRKEGKPLGDLVVGQVVEGRVTNRLYERVWVDIGASRDASFWAPEGGGFCVGDVVRDLTIVNINMDKRHIVLRPPESTDAGTARETVK